MKNSYDYPEIYKSLGLNMSKLGCLMLDVDGSEIPLFKGVNKDIFYFSEDPEKFWIQGFVAGVNPHISLLCGFLKTAEEWKQYINILLDGWKPEPLKIKSVGYFDSHEPCYCIVAHIEPTQNLIDGRERLQLLPHIDSFPGGYKPHLTLAYIKKDEKVRNEIVDFYNQRLTDIELPVLGLNYGGNK